jgi:hypothetical protein
VSACVTNCAFDTSLGLGEQFGDCSGTMSRGTAERGTTLNLRSMDEKYRSGKGQLGSESDGFQDQHQRAY